MVETDIYIFTLENLFESELEFSYMKKSKCETDNFELQIKQGSFQ